MTKSYIFKILTYRRDVERPFQPLGVMFKLSKLIGLKLLLYRYLSKIERLKFTFLATLSYFTMREFITKKTI